MKISERGLNLIKKFEGFSAKAYPDPISKGEPYTIGYGSTFVKGKKVELGQTISIEDATKELERTANYFLSKVESLILKPLNQNQVDALASFLYNLGPGVLGSSTLLKRINEGDYKAAAEQFLRWNKVGKEVIPGLTNRRWAERALFLSPML